MVDVPKAILIEENTTNPLLTKVSTNNVNVINSEFLYNNFHKNRIFAISTDYPNGNQYKIYNASGVPFCFDDYEKLRTSNKMQDDLGRNGEILSCRWNVEEQTAEIEYKISEAYTNNLRTEVITPDGK